MKVLLLSLGVFLAVGVLAVPLAYAETRSPPEATAHALDELANACAQRRPECPPTLTPTPMLTATPAPTSTSTPIPPTDTPTPTATATPEPEPCWLTDQALGDPDNGYIVFDEVGAPVPCPPDQPLPTDEPAPTPESRAVNAETPAIARPTPVVVSAASQPVAAVPLPALPTYTPYPTYTPQPTYTPVVTPSPTSTSTRVPTATTTCTATPAATVTVTTARATPTSVPIAARGSSGSTTTPRAGSWEWPAFLGYLAAAIGIAVLFIVFVTRRRVAVWKGTPHA